MITKLENVKDKIQKENMESLVKYLKDDFNVNDFDIKLITRSYFGEWVVWDYASINEYGIFVITGNEGVVNINGAIDMKTKILVKDTKDRNIILMVDTYNAEYINDKIIAIDNTTFYKISYGAIIKKKGYIDEYLPETPYITSYEILENTLNNIDKYGFNYKYPSLMNFKKEIPNTYKRQGIMYVPTTEYVNINLCKYILSNILSEGKIKIFQALNSEEIEDLTKFLLNSNLGYSIDGAVITIEKKF